MRFKGTVTLLALVTLLGGWVYWTDFRGREERARAEEAAGLVLPVDPAEIEEIGLIYPNTQLVASRVEAGWEFVSPPGLEADAAAWDQVAGNVGRIERDASVEAAGTDLSAYGLAAPELVVEVGFSDGRTEEIHFGNPNPAGGFNYTRLGSSPGLFLTASTWRGLFVKAADDLRDRTLLRFDQGQIDHIQLPGAGVRLVKDANAWFIEGEPRLRADDTEVASLLSSLGTTRASGFGDDETLASEPPSGQVVVLGDSSGEEHSLVFGPAVNGDPQQVYARDRSRDAVFTVGVALRDRVLRPLSQWRDKTIADVDPDSVTSIEIVPSGEAGFSVERVDGGWSLGDGRPARTSQVEAMLQAFDFQRASEVLDDPGALVGYEIDPPRLRIRLASTAAEIQDFSFGSDVPGTESVYWKSAAEDAVKIVARSVMDPFDITADELAEVAEE